MRRFLLLSLLTLGTLLADLTLYPKQSCVLYDSIDHTKPASMRLDMHRTYTMLEHRDGQYLLDIDGKRKWTDDDCLTLRPLRGTPLYAQTHRSTKQASKPVASHASRIVAKQLLALSWHNAFCETHRYRKECKRPLFGKAASQGRFVLHGLWPQPRNKVYCNVPYRLKRLDKAKRWDKLPEPPLDAEIKRKLFSVMPGAISGLHKHEWIKHGTCYGTDASRYFADAIALYEQFRQSRAAAYIRRNVGKRVTLQKVRDLVDKEFGKESGKRVEFRCKHGMLTELWLHLGGSSNDLAKRLQKGDTTYSRCRRAYIDTAAYGK